MGAPKTFIPAKLSWFVAAALVLASCSKPGEHKSLVSPPPAASSADQTLTGRVVSIADGDTVTVLDADDIQHRIRLSGIDAPESHQAFGSRSKQSLSEL